MKVLILLVAISGFMNGLSWHSAHAGYIELKELRDENR